MLRIPCYQHDSYDSTCSSCREMNGVSEQRPRPMPTETKPSAAAQKLALKLFCAGPGEYEQLPTWEEAAALIDAALVELREAAGETVGLLGYGSNPTKDKLARALAPWEPKS